MASQTSKGEQFILQFNLLKKTLLDERQKMATLQSENNALKEDLVIQKEVCEKLQIQLNSFRENASNDKKGLSFFSSLFLMGQDETANVHLEDKVKDDLINKLTIENSDLREQLASIQHEKDYTASKLKEQLTEYDKLKEMTEEKIRSIHKEYQDNVTSYHDEVKRIESLSSVIKKLEQERISQEQDNNLLFNDIATKAISLETLFMEQNQLLEEIEELKQEVFVLKKENAGLIEQLESLSPVTKNTVFKGMRIISINPKKTTTIELKFSDSDKTIVVAEENKNCKVFALKFIPEMKKIEPNVIKFVVRIEDIEEVYLIEFAEKYIEYIMKYYREGTLKKKFIETLLLSYNIGDNFV